MGSFLSHDVKLTKVADAATAATSAINSASVDMASDGGWENVMFFTSFATAAANNLIHAESSNDNGVSDAFADIAGSEVDASGASDEDQYIDIARPPGRYVRCVALRGTSTACGDIWAIQYNGRNRPQVNEISGTIYGKRISDPANGTK